MHLKNIQMKIAVNFQIFKCKNFLITYFIDNFHSDTKFYIKN
jgi:hypothetical protein